METLYHSREAVLTIALIVWFLSAFRDNLFHTYYWQLKEYRWDRMMEFLRSVKGKMLLLSRFNAFRVVVLGLIIYDILYPNVGDKLSVTALLAVSALGVFVVAGFVKSFIEHKFFRPKPTLKALMILGASFAIEIGVLIYFPNKLMTVLSLEIARPLIVGALVQLMDMM